MMFKLMILKESDVTQSYVDWYSNRDVTSFSDNQYRIFTLDGQKNYVNSCLNNDDIDLYGIFFGDLHIGNIVISGLSSVHKRAEITYVIGDTEYWGKGAASYAISEIVKKSKTDYGLNRLYAGLAEGNIGSARVLEKNGFKLEGKRLNHLFYGGEFHNQLDYGLQL